jgi:acyl-CoA thioesterase II
MRMTVAIGNLLGILDLEPLEHNLFRGRSPQVGWQRVFGGQVIGQALAAASRTVEAERQAHSLHGYFLRPGDPAVPIIYEVDRIRDGKSFTTRRVVAIQHGHAIFSMSVSYQVAEDGLEHQLPAPQVPPPEQLMSEDEVKKRFMQEAPAPMKSYWERERPIELRPVSLRHYVSRLKLEPVQQVWFRATGPLPRRSRAAEMRDRLCLRHAATRHVALPAWPLAVRPRPAGCQPRPCAVVPPPLPLRRLAALRPGQPDGFRQPRLQPRLDLYTGRRPRRIGSAGRPDPRLA